MSELQPCDKELWAFGHKVGTYVTNCTEFEIECAINGAVILTEEPLVWHLMNGQVIVKCKRGRKEVVKETVDMLIKLKNDYHVSDSELSVISVRSEMK